MCFMNEYASSGTGWIRDVDWKELARDYGTPIYVYSEEFITKRARTLKDLFRELNVDLYYAMKANTNPEILRLITNEGYGLEGVSIYEVKIGLSIVQDNRKIMLTSCCLDDETLLEAIRLGIKINADSWNQLSFLLANNHEDIGVRIDLGFGAGHHAYTTTGGWQSKFGIGIDEFIHFLETESPSGKIRRLHFHLGSGISSPEIYIKALDELWQKILKYRAFAEIDIGGGFSYPYRKEDKEFDFNNLKKNLEAFASNYEKVHGFSPRIILEPGRWIVAGGGVLVAKVTDIKTKSGQTFVTLNTGMQHLIRPALYRSYHEVLFLQKDTDFVKAFIAGNSCENADVMPLERTVPASLKRGDLALVLDVGAYGYVMSSNYNSYPRPREIIIRKNGRIEETISFDKYLSEILRK